MHTLRTPRCITALPYQWHLYMRRQPIRLAHAPRLLLPRTHHKHHHSRAHLWALQRLMATDLPRLLRCHKAPQWPTVYESLLGLYEPKWRRYNRIRVH